MAGYDVQVIDHYPQQLHCGICTLIIHDATHGCSKHVFCKACIAKYIEKGIKNNGNVMCPGGCGSVINPKKLEPSEFVDRMIYTLSCKCSNDMCEWKGDLLDLVQDHQRNCNYNLQLCDNGGCEVKYYKIDVVQHDEVCLYKLIQCAYCQTNILRMDKEQHDIVCLNELVNCAYHDIGCLLKVCRKDLVSHEETYQAEHTKLIYQNLITCKKELLSSQHEISVLKEENTKIKENNILLKKEVKTIAIELKKSKKRNSIPADEEKSDISCLERKLHSTRSLHKKVLLMNDGEVLMLKGNSNLDKLSECYEKNNFDYLIDQYHLSHHRNLMTELFGKTTYHFFEYQKDAQYKFIFPLDLNTIDDFEITIPDWFKVDVSNNEIIVENLSEDNYKCNRSCLYIDKYLRKLFHKAEFDLGNLEGFTACSSPFAHGYGCLDFHWELVQIES